MNTTTARRLLDLVFEGHHVRTVIQDGKPFFVAKDVGAACGLAKYRDAIRTHLDPDEGCPVEMDTPGGRQKMLCITETGVAALVMCSRKPAARRFRRWLLGDVLPQLLTYGSYLPGASPAERLGALHRRWREERRACLAQGEAQLAHTGLLTLRAFRAEHGVPARDVLPIARRLQLLAARRGVRPLKLVLPGHRNPAHAWPRHLLAEAVNSTQPRLPLGD